MTDKEYATNEPVRLTESSINPTILNQSNSVNTF